MKFVRINIYSLIGTGLFIVLRLIFKFLLELLNITPEPLASITSFVALVVIAIFYIDWNMRR